MTQPAADIKIAATNTLWSTGDYTTEPTKVAPTAGELADGLVGGEPVLVQHLNSILNNLALWIDHARDDLNGMFGTGADGNVTIAAGTTTLTRDMAYQNLTVETGGILVTAGYRVQVRGLLTIEAGGRIHNDGGNGGAAIAGGTGGTAGAAGAAGSLGGGAPGVAGVNGSVGVGNAGTNVADSVGGDGGAGGGTVAPAIAGGAAGVGTDAAATDGGTQSLTSIDGYIIGGGNASPGLLTNLRGGAGGGSGACDSATDASGGSGGGGGLVCLRAHTILIDADAVPAISADGGDAGAGESSGQDVGGSAGGGGGSVRIAYRRLYDGTSLATATPREPADLAGAGILVQAAGGLGAPGLSGANNGADGQAGTVVWCQI